MTSSDVEDATLALTLVCLVFLLLGLLGALLDNGLQPASASPPAGWPRRGSRLSR